MARSPINSNSRERTTSSGVRTRGGRTTNSQTRDQSNSHEGYHSFPSGPARHAEHSNRLIYRRRTTRPRPAPPLSNQPSIVPQSSSANVPHVSASPSPRAAPSPAAAPTSTSNAIVVLPPIKVMKIRVVQASTKVPPTFVPSAAKIISASFRQKQDEKSTSWKTLSKTKREFYWQEFEKRCNWTQPTHIIRSAWDRIAPIRYSGWQYNLKKETVCPTWCTPSAWKARRAHWGKTEVKAMSEIKAANRRGKSGNPPSIHVGGSKSHLEHMLEINEKTGNMPSFLEHFKTMHQRKSLDSETVFVDAKSKLLNDKLEAKIKEIQDNMEASGEDGEIDENKVFLQVVEEMGGKAKGRVYALGNRVSSMSEDGSMSSTAATETEAPSMTQEQMVQIGRLVEEAVSKRMSEVVEKVLQHISQDTQVSPNDSSIGEHMEEDEGVETDFDDV